VRTAVSGEGARPLIGRGAKAYSSALPKFRVNRVLQEPMNLQHDRLYVDIPRNIPNVERDLSSLGQFRSNDMRCDDA
jgi:hypothetical protein